MLSEEGTVRSVHGSKATVITERGSACQACGARSGCHALGGGGREMLVEALNEAHAEAGDRVQLSIQESSLLKASILVYLIPVLTLVVGAVLGKSLGERLALNADLLAFGVGIVAFAVALMLVQSRGRKLGEKAQYIPIVTRILARGENGALSPECERIDPKNT